MLRRILAISGRPGLFRLLTQGRNNIIVEDLTSGRRMPVHARDRISSLGDISIYTIEGDEPLPDVMQKIYDKNGGKPVENLTEEGLREAFDQFMPEHDHERVHNSDIKKLFQWYNLLVNQGFTQFKEEETEAADEAPAAAADKK